jgi:hypothetical protein
MLGSLRTLPNNVVSRITRERRGGRTWSAIANGLNADRVPTTQGGQRWYPATVRSDTSGTNIGAPAMAASLLRY